MQEYYESLHSEELMKLVESNDALALDALDVCKQILEKRTENSAECLELAKTIYKERVKKFYLDGGYQALEPPVFFSRYLNEEEKREITTITFIKVKETIEDLNGNIKGYT